MEKFVKILKKLFPFTIILILVYFIPPVFILVQQEEEVIERMLTADLMILNPGISFIAAMAFGVRNGFHWYFVLLVVILFFLCLLFIYGFSFFGFLLIYGVAAILGLSLGKSLKEGRDEMYLWLYRKALWQKELRLDKIFYKKLRYLYSSSCPYCFL